MTFGLALYPFGWGWAVQTLSGSETSLFPAREMVILAPFLVGLICSWIFWYDAERAFQAGPLRRDAFAARYWSRWAYVGFHLRHNLGLVSIPIMLVIATKAMSRLFDIKKGSGPWDWYLSTGVGLLGILAVFAGIPWALRFILGLKPLPAGPLRDRLLSAARRLRFRVTNIMVWNTHGGVANAMVAGVLPFLRYVIVTDRLIADLTPDEVEAVFGHEVGHVKHHHMLVYLSFLLISLAAMAELADLLVAQKGSLAYRIANSIASQADLLQSLPGVAIVGAYVFVVFGFLSRRCECQADIFGCRAVSCDRLGLFGARGRDGAPSLRCGFVSHGHSHLYWGVGEGRLRERHQSGPAWLVAIVAAFHHRQQSRFLAEDAGRSRRREKFSAQGVSGEMRLVPVPRRAPADRADLVVRPRKAIRKPLGHDRDAGTGSVLFQTVHHACSTVAAGSTWQRRSISGARPWLTTFTRQRCTTWASFSNCH